MNPYRYPSRSFLKYVPLKEPSCNYQGQVFSALLPRLPELNPPLAEGALTDRDGDAELGPWA